MDMDWKRGALGIIILVVLVAALFLTFNPEKCPNFECFQKRMIECKSTSYINEEPEASWGYKIIGKRAGKCEIEVTLLGAKEGSLDLRKYEGNSMSCFFDEGFVTYPEKDLDACHGELKENLQNVIIEKLYNYIISNLGEIQEELRRV